MWIIILKKWRFEGTLHNEDFHRYTIHMFPLCFVTYEILHEINIDLLRIHTPEMYINVWKKGGFEHTIHAWGFVCTIYIPPNTPPPLKRKRYLVRYTIPSVIYIHRIRLNTPVNSCKFSKNDDLKAQFISDELYKQNSYVKKHRLRYLNTTWILNLSASSKYKQMNINLIFHVVTKNWFFS